MAALEPQHMTVLKKVLAERFVQFLPPLLGAAKPEDQVAKQLSRAFSAFALHKLLNITPKDAAASVVDDFNDKGLDAIHYHAPTKTLYLLQAKLKESEQFKQDEAQSFCTGIRLLLKQDFTGFNVNVQNRQAEIESALDACSHIKLLVTYTGDGVSQSAIEGLQLLLDDDDLDEERLDKQVDYYAAADIARDLLAEQSYPPVHTDVALQKHAKVESPRTTYYGIARLRVLASQQDDPRYAVWLKSEPARLANSESAEYQALFPVTLTGVALVNAVLCHRAIRTLVVDYEQKAAARSQEKLIYRHAIHLITAVMMKRLRQRIGTAAVIDAATIPGLISQPLDQLRQQTFDLGRQRLLGEGPLAYFRNQGSVAAFLADLLEIHFGLAADPVLPNLRNINTAADSYPRKRLLDYLSKLAPQLQ